MGISESAKVIGGWHSFLGRLRHRLFCKCRRPLVMLTRRHLAHNWTSSRRRGIRLNDVPSLQLLGLQEKVNSSVSVGAIKLSVPRPSSLMAVFGAACLREHCLERINVTGRALCGVALDGHKSRHSA